LPIVFLESDVFKKLVIPVDTSYTADIKTLSITCDFIKGSIVTLDGKAKAVATVNVSAVRGETVNSNLTPIAVNVSSTSCTPRDFVVEGVGDGVDVLDIVELPVDVNDFIPRVEGLFDIDEIRLFCALADVE